MFDLNKYQDSIKQFAIYPEAGKRTINAITYNALQAAAETGEFAGKVAKWIRDGNFDVAFARKELGDAFWHITRLAEELGTTLNEIADENIQKLTDRVTRGVLQGSGDAR